MPYKYWYDIIETATRQGMTRHPPKPQLGAKGGVSMVVTTDMLIVVIAFASLVVAIIVASKKD